MERISVLIMGHSFVRRLEGQMSGSWYNLGFDESLMAIHCCGRGGGKVGHLLQSDMSRALARHRPAVVVLQIGGNDLDSPLCEDLSGRLARDIFSIASWMVSGFGVASVCVMQLMYRSKTRHAPVDNYNSAVDVVNANLRTLCADSSDCFFWRHKGLKTGIFSCLSQDGVHLSRKGSRKYILSVRGAVLKGKSLSASRSAI
ncbi:uncharacterized protein [Argopecten irradians]|uniref:uncharacterized protein n=1 Tax=Argopecten irradians TaxID=31199 RepID=UPI00371B4621